MTLKRNFLFIRKCILFVSNLVLTPTSNFGVPMSYLSPTFMFCLSVCLSVYLSTSTHIQVYTCENTYNILSLVIVIHMYTVTRLLTVAWATHKVPQSGRKLSLSPASTACGLGRKSSAIPAGTLTRLMLCLSYAAPTAVESSWVQLLSS